MITGLECCDGVWIHADWCNEEKPERKFDIGDRVTDTNTKSNGIVFALGYIKNEGGIEARCAVYWTKDNSQELVEFESQGWIVEGNLILTTQDKTEK